MNYFNKWWALVKARLFIMMRQRLGILTLFVGVAIVPLSLITARASFVKSEKIFWDFCLGIIFVLQVLLGTYLSAHMLQEEKARRTLHMTIATGIPRGVWMCGQAFGVWLGLCCMILIWTLCSSGAAFLVGGTLPNPIIYQAQILLMAEMLMVVFLTTFLSIFVRGALAWLLSISFVALAHSITSIQNIFQNQQYGRYVKMDFYEYVFQIFNFLPPLEWYDIRVFVGYREPFEATMILSLVLLAVAWAIFLSLASSFRLSKVDL